MASTTVVMSVSTSLGQFTMAVEESGGFVLEVSCTDQERCGFYLSKWERKEPNKYVASFFDADGGLLGDAFTRALHAIDVGYTDATWLACHAEVNGMAQKTAVTVPPLPKMRRGGFEL